MVETTAPMPPPDAFLAGAGRLCLDFVRTVYRRGHADEHEELASTRDVVAWVTAFGPGLRAAAEDERDAGAVARRLREAVYDLLVAAMSDGGVRSCPGGARETINEVAAHPPPAPRMDADGDVSDHADRPVAATLALVARDALDLVRSPDLARLRRCADPDCAIFFVDRSPPGTRRWCSMNRCGNRAKKSSIRARGAATGR